MRPQCTGCHRCTAIRAAAGHDEGVVAHTVVARIFGACVAIAAFNVGLAGLRQATIAAVQNTAIDGQRVAVGAIQMRIATCRIAVQRGHIHHVFTRTCDTSMPGAWVAILTIRQIPTGALLDACFARKDTGAASARLKCAWIIVGTIRSLLATWQFMDLMTASVARTPVCRAWIVVEAFLVRYAATGLRQMAAFKVDAAIDCAGVAVIAIVDLAATWRRPRRRAGFGIVPTRTICLTNIRATKVAIVTIIVVATGVERHADATAAVLTIEVFLGAR